MKASQPLHWAGLGETTFVAGIRFLYFVERWLGRWPFRMCLYPVVLCHWLLNHTARRASREYLQRLQAAHAVFPRPPGVWRSLRHFTCFAETILDKLLASQGRYPSARVQVEHEVIRQQIARGEGGVIITAHLGCLELCQMLAETVPDFRLTVLVHTAHAAAFNGLLRRLNPDTPVELLQVTELDVATAVRLGERVAAGEFVAITGDRVPVHGERYTMAHFLGWPAPFPVGPYILASVLECPLFAMACTHQGEGYRVRFERFADRVVLPRGEREAALAEQTVRFAGWLEEQLRHSPLDWFNFFPFWNQTPHDPAAH